MDRDLISTSIILDELIEQAHHENVEDVIFWALESFSKECKDTTGRMIAFSIVERVKEAEETGTLNLQNPELIKTIIKQ